MKQHPIKDFLVSNETFTLRFDSSINALQTTPELSPESLHKYYPDETYLSHVDKATGLKDSVYMWVKKLNIQTKLKWISKAKTRGKLLDFGAGNGAFVQAAAAKGWKTVAFDFSETAKKILSKKGISQITETHLNDKYDAITLWHVFEHLPNPEQHLNRFYEALSPGGILVLALPNYCAWDAKHYGAFWAAYDVPRHLWHYNKTAVFGLAKKAGFNVLKTYNMFWDAFYIALLSEQYKNTTCPWFFAFFKGLYSNLKGWSTYNTSSLTFILQKPI